MVRRRNRRPRASAPPQQGCLGLSLGVFEVQNQSESTSSADDFPPADTLNYLEGEDHCAMCNSRPARRCLWCQSSSYCSVECQEKDFPTHKLLCQQTPSFPPRPSQKHVRAIFFPETDYRPQLTWVEYESGVDNFNGTNWTKLLTDPYLGYNSPKKGRVRIEENPMRSRTFGIGFKSRSSTREGYCITMLYTASGNHCPNESITTSLSVAGAGESPISGPVLVVRERPGKVYEDIALSDLRNIVDYFLSHLASLAASRIVHAPTTGPEAPVNGVLIRCRGDIYEKAGIGFESVDISTVSCALGDTGAISPISKVLGMPLSLHKCSIPGPERNRSNSNAAMLMLDIDPEGNDWGMAPWYWNCPIGDVLVVRDGGGNLEVRDVEMICHFARFKMQPMIEQVAEETAERECEAEHVDAVAAKQNVVDFITWDNMVHHWDEMGCKGFDIEVY